MDVVLPAPGSLGWLQTWAAGGVLEIAGFIVVLNLTAFLTFAWDKFCAQNRMWRVSEGTLLLIALFGGSVGAITAQHWLRHKTRKEPFRTQLYLIAAAHVILLITMVVWPAASPFFEAAVAL